MEPRKINLFPESDTVKSANPLHDEISKNIKYDNMLKTYYHIRFCKPEFLKRL